MTNGEAIENALGIILLRAPEMARDVSYLRRRAKLQGLGKLYASRFNKVASDAMKEAEFAGEPFSADERSIIADVVMRLDGIQQVRPVGRPRLSEDGRTVRVVVTLGVAEVDILDRYCSVKSKNRSEAVRDAIAQLEVE